MHSLVGDRKDPSPSEYLFALNKRMSEIPDDPLDRNPTTKPRLADGILDEDNLVEILTSSIEDPAGAFGPYNVPLVWISVASDFLPTPG